MVIREIYQHPYCYQHLHCSHKKRMGVPLHMPVETSNYFAISQSHDLISSFLTRKINPQKNNLLIIFKIKSKTNFLIPTINLQ